MSSFESTLSEVIRVANTPLLKKIDHLTKKIDEMQAADRPEFVTVQEAAKILHCCDQTIRRRVHDGALESKKDGKAILIRYDDLVN